MPTTNDRISLVNDTEDVTAVKAPPPGLILESKAALKPPAIAAAKTQAVDPRSATITPPATKPIGYRSADAKSAAAKAASTMATVAAATSPPAKPRLSGQTLMAPPSSRPLATLLSPPAPATRPPPAMAATPPAGLPAIGSGPVPFIRPLAAPTKGVPVPIAPPAVSSPTAPLAPARATTTTAAAPTTTLAIPPSARHAPPERALAPLATPAPRAVVDLVPMTASSGPLLAPRADAWTTRQAPTRSRTVLYAALATLLIAGGAAVGWKQWWSVRAGRIEISTTPTGAIVTLGGDAEPRHSPVMFEKAPGSYTISITRDGFQRTDRTIDLRAGQEVMLSIALAPVDAGSKPMAIVPEPIGGGSRANLAASAAARHPAPGGTTPPRAVIARSMAQLDAAFTARANARAMALAGAATDDGVDERAAAIATPAPAGTPITAAATATTESAPPLPATAGSNAKAEPAPPSATVAAASASTATSTATTKTEPFEKSGPPSADIASARTISGRLARAQLVIDSNADEYRVKLPPSLARAEMKLSAVVKMCVSAEGKVADVKLLKSADPAVDAQIPAVLGKWRYRPLVVDGRAVPFCYVLQYEIATP